MGLSFTRSGLVGVVAAMTLIAGCGDDDDDDQAQQQQ